MDTKKDIQSGWGLGEGCYTPRTYNYLGKIHILPCPNNPRPLLVADNEPYILVTFVPAVSTFVLTVRLPYC